MAVKEHIIETETGCGWLEDDIIHYIFKKSKVDLPEAKESVEIMTTIAEEKAYPYLIDMSRMKTITKEARAYLAIPRSSEKNIATAALTPNLIAKLIGTFFISFNNPSVRIKLFTEEHEAIRWLKKEASARI